MKLLAPSLLSADFRSLENQIKLVEAGGADIIHCDTFIECVLSFFLSF